MAGLVEVRVRSFATLREIMDRETVVVMRGEATVGRLLGELVRRYPGLEEALFASPGVLHDAVNVLKNGRNTFFLEGLETPLAHGDTVALFPPVGGGSSPGATPGECQQCRWCIPAGAGMREGDMYRELRYGAMR